jgi:abhydrolase domain-containing protein 14
VERHASELRAFVALAPVGADTAGRPLGSAALRVLSIVGSSDSWGRTQAAALLSAFPSHRAHVMEGAGHACYADRPDAFHALLLDGLRWALSP